MRRCQWRTRTLQVKFCIVYQCSCLSILSQSAEKYSRPFFYQLLTSLVFIYWTLSMRNWKKVGAARNCGKWWVTEAVKFSEIVLGTAVLEEMLWTKVWVAFCPFGLYYTGKQLMWWDWFHKLFRWWMSIIDWYVNVVVTEKKYDFFWVDCLSRTH